MSAQFETKAQEIEDLVNTAYAEHKVVMVDGRKVKAYGKPAHIYMNGTLSITVVAKKAGSTVDLFFKEGHRLPVIEIVEA